MLEPFRLQARLLPTFLDLLLGGFLYLSLLAVLEGGEGDPVCPGLDGRCKDLPISMSLLGEVLLISQTL